MDALGARLRHGGSGRAHSQAAGDLICSDEPVPVQVEQQVPMDEPQPRRSASGADETLSRHHLVHMGMRMHMHLIESIGYWNCTTHDLFFCNVFSCSFGLRIRIESSETGGPWAID